MNEEKRSNDKKKTALGSPKVRLDFKDFLISRYNG